MKITFIEKLKRAYKGYTGSLSDVEHWDEFYNTSTLTNAGIRIDADKALTYSPVWQGIDLISGDISRLPLIVYERIETEHGSGKQRATNHAAYNILKRSANNRLTANLWRSRMISHALLYGNSYSYIERDNQFNPIGLHWIHTENVECCWDGQRNFYRIRNNTTCGDLDHIPKIVAAEEMFHLQGLTVNYNGGCGIVHFAAQTIGKQLAADQYGAEFFANGAVAQGFLSHPGQLTEDARKNFLRGWNQRHQGQGNHHKICLLEEGITWSDMGVSPEDAMLIDVANFGIKDIARFFNLPPGKLGDDSRTSYSSVEQENRSYFNSTLGKWISRIEAEANAKLFSQREMDSDSHFAEFKLDALFKADTSERFAAYSTAIQWGIKTRNEVRAEENLNPIAGGDVCITPMNMQTIDENELSEDYELEESENSRSDLLARQAALVDAFKRVNKRMMLRAKKLSPEKYLAGVNQLTEQLPIIKEMLWPALRLAGADADLECKNYLEHISDGLLNAADCQPDQLKTRVTDFETSLNEWTVSRAIELLESKQCKK